MSIIPCVHWLTPTHTDDSNHTSSMMPPYPLTSPLPYSMQESLISPMGGNTAQITSTQIANGVHMQDTLWSNAPKSHNAFSAMERYTSRHTAATRISAPDKVKP